MTGVSRICLLLLLVSSLALRLGADVRQCACRLNDAAAMARRECGLCRVAEQYTGPEEFFVIKDSSPVKPHRWLVLPKSHGAGSHPLHLLPQATRVRLWRFAIAEARQRFGETGWGVAYNGDRVRTQCHLHLHLGRFIAAAENSRGRLCRRIAEFPAPDEGGIMVHPVKGGYHVHTGDQVMETMLVR
jgi:hypothetical protein